MVGTHQALLFHLQTLFQQSPTQQLQLAFKLLPENLLDFAPAIA
jgi:hypothetical protein